MLIELIRPYKLWGPGQRFDMGRGEATLLVDRNIAKRVEDDEPKPKRKYTKRAKPTE